MKSVFVCLLVCGTLSFTARASQRGSLDTSSLDDVYVQDISIDTTKQQAQVSLAPLETPFPILGPVSPPPIEPVQPVGSSQPVAPRPPVVPRSVAGGDGPLPIAPFACRTDRCDGDGTRVTLDLTNASDRHIYQMVLQARDGAAALDFSFDKTGAISSVSLFRSYIIGGQVGPTPVGPVPPASRGTLQIGDLGYVSVAAVTFDVTKNTASLALEQAPECEAIPATREPVVSYRPRCGTTPSGLSLNLDLSNASDCSSFGTFLASYANGSVLNLGFTTSGELTTIEVLSALTIYTNYRVRYYYEPVTTYRQVGGHWTPFTTYVLRAYRQSSVASTR